MDQTIRKTYSLKTVHKIWGRMGLFALFQLVFVVVYSYLIGGFEENIKLSASGQFFLYVSLILGLIAAFGFTFLSQNTTLILSSDGISIPAAGINVTWGEVLRYRIDRMTNSRNNTRRILIKTGKITIRLIARENADTIQFINELKAQLIENAPKAANFHSSQNRFVEAGILLLVYFTVMAALLFNLDNKPLFLLIMTPVSIIVLIVIYQEYK